MDIVRVDSMDDLPPLDANLQIRKTEEGAFSVGYAKDDAKSRIVGIYATPGAAEKAGIEAAEREGVRTLYIAAIGY